jgi:hypothetical protein
VGFQRLLEMMEHSGAVETKRIVREFEEVMEEAFVKAVV